LGSVLGPLLGALILAVADWRAIFWLNAAAGIILAVAVAAVGGAPLTRPRPVPTALAVLALAVTALALAAPETLVTSVSLGVPFINFDGTTARLATPIGVLALALCALAAAVLLRRVWPVLRRADLLGALLLGGALGCVVLTFASANPEKEVVGSLGLGLLPIAAVLAAAYLVHHRRAANPLVPAGLVRGRTRWALIVSALVGVALVSVVVDVPLLARLVQSENQTEAALVLVRFLVAVPVGALLGGWSLRYLSDGLVAAVGLALASAGLFIMTGWARGSLATVSSVVVLAMVGFGVGLALAPVNNAALADAPQEAHGTASALIVVARMVGMVVGLALLTAIGLHAFYEAVDGIADINDREGLVDAALVPVHWVFRGAAIAAAAGALLALQLGTARRLSRE
jgi:MFS family permease